jgi:hypothetical protein
MRKHSRFLLELFAFMFVAALPVIYLAGCSDSSTPPPEFVGTWQVSPMAPGRGALTLTLAETSFTLTAADAPPPSPDLETDMGTISDIDTTLKHFTLNVKSVTLAGTENAHWVVGDIIFVLYSLSGNTLTINMSTTGYPADLTGGGALTRL